MQKKPLPKLRTLLACLGNPGPRYETTRHNSGFLLADALVMAELGPTPGWRSRFGGLSCKVNLGTTEVQVLKPQTFMNRSGTAVAAHARYHQIDMADVLVVHDELDLDFGVLRLKVGGGFGGHNGLKSVAQHLGGPDFARLRLGIGRPHGQQAVESYVLSDFSREEAAHYADVLNRGVAMVRSFVIEGAAATMNAFHGA